MACMSVLRSRDLGVYLCLARLLYVTIAAHRNLAIIESTSFQFTLCSFFPLYQFPNYNVIPFRKIKGGDVEFSLRITSCFFCFFFECTQIPGSPLLGTVTVFFSSCETKTLSLHQIGITGFHCSTSTLLRLRLVVCVSPYPR